MKKPRNWMEDMDQTLDDDDRRNKKLAAKIKDPKEKAFFKKMYCKGNKKKK